MSLITCRQGLPRPSPFFQILANFLNLVKMPISIVECCDNIEFMKKFPDNFFDLGCVDHGYGIGQNWKKNVKGVHYNHNSSYKNDSIPSEEYFYQLARVSKNQIIWGGNYFTEFLRPSKGLNKLIRPVVKHEVKPLLHQSVTRTVEFLEAELNRVNKINEHLRVTIQELEAIIFK